MTDAYNDYQEFLQVWELFKNRQNNYKRKFHNVILTKAQNTYKCEIVTKVDVKFLYPERTSFDEYFVIIGDIIFDTGEVLTNEKITLKRKDYVDVIV